MFHKIKNAITKENYILHVVFMNGTEKVYDVKPLFADSPVFLDLLKIQSLFEQVKVDAGGFGISWNDEFDLSCDELWNRGKLLSK